MEIVTVESRKAGILRRKAKPVGKATAEIQRLVDAMIETMHEASGIGLAAPQVGVSKRVIITEVEERLHVVIDPKLVKQAGEESGTEGCLSIPGVLADVPRAVRVVVKGKNRRGRGITIDAEGLLARVLQHEIDHLDGILFLDRVVDRSTIRRAQPEEVEVAPALRPFDSAQGRQSSGQASG